MNLREEAKATQWAPEPLSPRTSDPGSPIAHHIHTHAHCARVCPPGHSSEYPKAEAAPGVSGLCNQLVEAGEGPQETLWPA